MVRACADDGGGDVRRVAGRLRGAIAALRVRQRSRGLPRPARGNPARPRRRPDRRRRGRSRAGRGLAPAARGRRCGNGQGGKHARCRGRRRRRRAVAIAALVALPFGAACIYLALGSPSLPGQPLAARRPDQSIESLVAQVETHLAAQSQRWPRLGGGRAGLSAARPLRRCGQGAAQRACVQRRDLRPAGRVSARRWSPPRRQCRHRRGEDRRSNARSRSMARTSRRAISSAWRPSRTAAPPTPRRSGARMLAGAPADAPWAEFVRSELARVEGGPPKGPSEQDVAAAIRPERRPAHRHDPRHGRATGGAPAPRRLRSRGMAAAGALLYGAGRARQGAGGGRRRAPRARAASRTSCAGSTSSSKGLGLEG